MLIGGIRSFIAYKQVTKDDNQCQNLAHPYYKPTISYSNTISQYADILKSESDIDNTTLWTPSLELPTGYGNAKRVGILHNMMLSRYLHAKPETTPDVSTLTANERSLIGSSSFEDYYNSCVGDGPIEAVVWASGSVDVVEASFLGAVMEFEGNAEEFDVLVNSYISLISERGDLTETEKRILIQGCCVAAYSFRYWTSL